LAFGDASAHRIRSSPQAERPPGTAGALGRVGDERLSRPAGDRQLTQNTDRARILYMTTLSLAEARANLSKLVESAVTTHERFEVTRNGDRAVVVLSAEDYDALLETVDVLSRAEEVQALKEGLDDLDAGLTSPLDEVRSAMLRRGRLQS
jgi:antitoxin YefM